MSCDVCVYASEHGSWPPDHRGTHCEDCHRSWSGMAEAHCTRCHQHFTSNGVADLHDSYCSPDSAAVAEALRDASREDGTPIFDVRERKDGSAWVRFDKRQHYQAVNR